MILKLFGKIQDGIGVPLLRGLDNYGARAIFRYTKQMDKDWCNKNPVNYGFNWMCGQKTSIRLINILITWRIINNKKVRKNIAVI